MAPRPRSHSSGISCPRRLAATSRSSAVSDFSSSITCSPEAIRLRRRAARPAASSIAVASDAPAVCVAGDLSKPRVDSTAALASVTACSAPFRPRTAAAKSRALPRRLPRERANPPGSCISESVSGEAPGLASATSSRTSPAAPSCSPKRRAACRAVAAARADSAASRSSRGCSSQRAATALRFFQIFSSAACDLISRAIFPRIRFRFAADRARPSRRFVASCQASRSAWISGAASSCARWSVVRRQSRNNGSRGTTARIVSSASFAWWWPLSQLAISASIRASSLPRAPAATAGAPMLASLPSAALRRCRIDSIGDTSGSVESSRSMATRRLSSTRVTRPRSRPLASS